MEKIKEIIELVELSQKILVFTGAGISTNCGIPDFRGENGLYSYVAQKYQLPYPEAVFEISYFKKNPQPFFHLSKEFFGENVHPTLAHQFVNWLEKKDKIALVMTQNIDMLHQKAGSKKVIECHGTYATWHCLQCSKSFVLEEVKKSFNEAIVPYCETCGGLIKPDVVFFNEQLPQAFFEAYYNPLKIDLLLVMGTSLNVQPAASFALKFLDQCKSIIINLESTIYDTKFTYAFKEDLDIFCKKLWDGLLMLYNP